MQWRGSSAAGTWSSWKTLLDSNNYSDYALPLTGGALSGHLYLTGAGQYSTNNTTQIIFKAGAEGEQIGAISAISSDNANGKAIVINPSATDLTNQIIFYFDKPSRFPNGITGDVFGAAKHASAAHISTT